MKGLREYEIPFVGLKIGVHTFNYEINGKFFSHFEDSPISECDVNVRLEFDKKETLFILNFFIDGEVAVECDRCLAPFRKEIFGDFVCYVKFTDNPDEIPSDDEILYISRDESHIDVSQLIYEYINICLPIQRIGCKEPGKDPKCNLEVLKFLLEQPKPEVKEEKPDPRWDALKKLNKN